MGETMKYEDFLEKIKGMSQEELEKYIDDNKWFWKNVSNLEIFTSLDFTLNKVLEFDRQFLGIYLYLKQECVFFDALDVFTNLESFPRDMNMDNYNILLENVLRKKNKSFNKYFELVDEGLNERRNTVLNDLYDIFKEGLPTEEELNNLQNGLNNMFDKESPEKLKIINDILEYNDPSMKKIKDFIHNDVLMNNIENNKDNKMNSQIDISDRIIAEGVDISKRIDKIPEIKKINENIKNNKEERVKQYAEEFEKEILDK